MQSKRKPRIFLFLLLASLLPAAAYACEPVVPLVMIFSGGVFLFAPLAALSIIVTIKAIAFVLIERRIDPLVAIGAIVLANIFSSIIGFIVAIGAIAPSGLLTVSVVLVILVSVKPASRFREVLPDRYASLGNKPIVAIIVALYIASFFLWGFASSLLSAEEHLASYWFLKVLYIFIALLISIFLTTLWEEWIVHLIAGKENIPDFFPSVLKANLVAFFFIMLIAALLMLPERLNSPNFLVQLFKEIHTWNPASASLP